MAITEKDIQYVADLARLNLSPDETDRLTRDMEEIIRYSMDKLSELDTENVEPMEHVLPIRNIFREDKSYESFDREEILRNAPDKADGCFRVPRTVD